MQCEVRCTVYRTSGSPCETRTSSTSHNHNATPTLCDYFRCKTERIESSHDAPPTEDSASPNVFWAVSAFPLGAWGASITLCMCRLRILSFSRILSELEMEFYKMPGTLSGKTDRDRVIGRSQTPCSGQVLWKPSPSLSGPSNNNNIAHLSTATISWRTLLCFYTLNSNTHPPLFSCTSPTACQVTVVLSHFVSSSPRVTVPVGPSVVPDAMDHPHEEKKTTQHRKG